MTDREKICKAIDDSNSNAGVINRINQTDISTEERTRALKIIDGYWCCSKDLKSLILTGQAICTK